MLGVYMPEKMQSRLNCRYAYKEFFRTVMNIVVKVEDAERRRMGNENVRIIGDICIMFGLAVTNAVTHEHWNAIEFQASNFYSGITQVMHIAIESVNGGTVKAIIVVTANEYLLRIRKVAEPVHEIQCLLLTAVHGKVTRMHDNVSLWQIVQPSVTAMRVRNMQYCHLECFLFSKNKGLLAQSAIQAVTILLLYIKVRHIEDTFTTR